MSGTAVIIPRVEGGLGNQMFIYAAARALALRTGTPLRLDIWSGFANTQFGDWYQLDKFNIAATMADKSELLDFDGRYYYWRRKLDRRLPFRFRRIVEERSLFEPRLLSLRPHGKIYLYGYWQREEYFRDQADAIRREFSWRSVHSLRNAALGQRMRECESVFLHLRQGKDFAHCLSEAYYSNALRMIAERVRNPRIFVFGRGVRSKGSYPDHGRTTAAQELRLSPDAEFVEHNGEADAHEDMWLMSQCRHAIVANSTFSWWGAWLNPEPNRIVIAPAEWGYRAAPASGWLTASADQMFTR